MATSFATRCKACDSILVSFDFSKPLPDGSVDDLCFQCKEAIYSSHAVRYRDYILEHIEDDSSTPEDY